MDIKPVNRRVWGPSREILKFLGVVAVLLLLMLWLAGVFTNKVQPGAAVQKARAGHFKTWTVKKVTYPLLIEQPGTVRSQFEALVSSRIMAEVKEIPVREGDLIKGSVETDRPTLLATLDDREIQARLRGAEAQLAASERGIEAAKEKLAAARALTDSARANNEKASYDLKRFKALAESKAVSGQQLDHSRTQREMTDAQLRAASREAQAVQGEIERMTAQREAAKAALSEARTMLSYARIYAPFDGRLVKKMVNVGDLASPGQALFLTESDRRPEFQAFLSESVLPNLQRGQELQVRVDALHRSFPAVLRDIIPQSDPATRTILVKLDLPPDPHLVNGLFGRLAIPRGEYDALVVPSNAVLETGQIYLLKVLDGEGHPRRRFVTLGKYHESDVEVLSGLRENEEVVIP